MQNFQNQSFHNEQLSIILKNALSSDSTVRKQSESQISQFLNQNAGYFIIELSKKISNEEEEKEIRLISSSIFKNALTNKKYIKVWYKYNSDIKKGIKENILSALVSKNKDIRKAASLSLAVICKLEISKGKWLDIFDLLINTSQNNDINIQISSLTSLDFIYEEINKDDIPNEIIGKLLNTYKLLLTQENKKISLIISILNSLLKFIPFIKDFMVDSTLRIKLYDLLEKYVKNENSKISKIALEIFTEICKEYYDTINEYMDNILNFSKIILEKGEESNKILCIELWNNIGIEEDNRMNVINNLKKKSQFILQKYSQPLGEICLQYIVIENYEDNYIDRYLLSKACSKLISLMSKCCQYNFLETMINYIKTNINSQNGKIKYSALNVLKSIMKTVHKSKFYKIVKDSLVIIAEILLDKNAPPHFQILCAKIISSINENFGKKLINDEIYFDKMIILYLELFKISIKKVLYKLLYSLSKLCSHIPYSDEGEQTNVISKYMKSLCDSLMKICSNINFYSTENNVVLLSFELLGILSEHSAKDVKSQMINLCKELVDMFEKSLEKNNFPNEEICYNYQKYIALCINSFLLSRFGDKITATKLLHFVIKSFEERKDIYEEGISLIGPIANLIKNDFNSVMKIVSPYIIKGLENHNNFDLLRVSILSLDDIINSLGKENNYINIYLPLIFNFLSDDDIDYSLKPLCFNIIGDIFIYCPNEALKYLDKIMNIIIEAMEVTSIQFDENSEQEKFDYFIELREKIIETITSIFYGVKENNKTKDFKPFINNIINYINDVGSDYECPLNIMLEGLMLITDFCDSYKKEIEPLLDFQLIKKMFKQIENNIEPNDNETQANLDYIKNTFDKVFDKNYLN